MANRVVPPHRRDPDDSHDSRYYRRGVDDLRNVIVSTEPPSNAEPGALWYNPEGVPEYGVDIGISKDDADQLYTSKDEFEAVADVPPRVEAVETQVQGVDVKATRADSRVFDVRAYGAVGDGVTDNRSAILACYQAIEAAGGGTMFFAPASGAYHVNTSLTLTVTVPLVVDLNGQRITINPDIYIVLRGAVQASGVALASAVTRGATSLSLTNAAAVRPGDVLYVTEPTITETAWNTPRQATFSVRSVSGGTAVLTSASKMPFTTAATITHYRPPSRLRVQNGTFHFGAGTVKDEGGSRLIRFQGVRALELDHLTVSSDQAWKSGGPGGTGLTIERCVNARLTNIHAEAVGYGMIVAASLNTSVVDMTAERVRHPVSPAAWADGVQVTNLTTNDVWQTVESHPAFDVNYSNVIAQRDETLPNLRCVGGSITNVKVVTDATDAAGGPYYHSLTLTDPSWYNDARLVMRGFEIVAPNVTTKTTVAVSQGHLVAENVVAHVAPDAMSDKYGPNVRSVTLINCRTPNGRPWPRAPFRSEVVVLDPPNLPAYLDGGVYHIDPYRHAVTAREGVLRCFGRIVEGGTTKPLPLTIRIHTNAFPAFANNPDYVFGVLRLRSTVRHSSLGAFDVLTHDYHFRHRIVATSSVQLPTTPAYVDAATGQENESLSMTLSNPTQAGRTELGANWPDTYIQFDLEITSDGSSAVYGLVYDLELIRG